MPFNTATATKSQPTEGEPAQKLCRKCMQPVELEVIPGSQRVELVKGKILSVADYQRLDLCYQHRKVEAGLISKASTVSRNDGTLDGRRS